MQPEVLPEATEFQGGVNRILRIGNRVHRPRQPWSTSVHTLLKHLAGEGLVGVPRAHGFDDQGREVLDYLPGQVGNYPLSSAIRSKSALISAARLLRSYHEASVAVALRGSGGWQFAARAPVQVICHGDFAPYNCVFRGSEAVGIIDFDTAHPGPRWWDLAYALYRFAPLSSPGDGDGFGLPAEQARRARTFLDAYGADRAERRLAVEGVPHRLRALVAHMRREAAAGSESFARHLADGHSDLYLRDIQYVERHATLLRSVVVDE